MTVLTWLLGALAFLLWPAGSADPSRPHRLGLRRPASSATVLPLAAGVAGAGALLAVFGVAALPVAAAVGAGLHWATGHLPAAADDPGSDPALPLTLELAAAALRAGRPVPDALRLAAPAGGPVLRSRLAVVSGLLALGEAPGQAWAALGSSGILEDVARAAARSSDSGVRLADTCTQAADDVRARLRTRDTVRAARAGTARAGPARALLPAGLHLSRRRAGGHRHPGRRLDGRRVTFGR